MDSSRWMWFASIGGTTLLFCALGCSRGAPVTSPVEATSQPAATTLVTASSNAKSQPAPAKPANPIVVLHTTAGDVKLELFADKSPQTVDNFLLNYATSGFYDQTVFHHVEAGMMLIGGGYTADMQAKPARTPIFNESRNGVSNRRGTVAMIRDPESPHSATSQFFINLADNLDFDFKAGEADDVLGYCVFGQVVAGLDVIDHIAKMPTTAIGEFAKVPSPSVAIQSVERLR